jgi:hypothetical protein
MDKIFEIAKEITNPYSLTALFFLILFVLYKVILSKVGQQEGVKGFIIIKRLMGLVALIAIVTLLLVFGLKAYAIYSKVDEVPEIGSLAAQIRQSSDSVTNKVITVLKAPELTVEYSLRKYEDASILIGNNGDKIILVKNLTIFWEYKECPAYREPTVGAPLVKYRYDVKISKSNDSKLIESKEFKYGKGDVDQFNVNIIYPGLGIYTVWFTFDYEIFGTDKWFKYKTEKGTREICER